MIDAVHTRACRVRTVYVFSLCVVSLSASRFTAGALLMFSVFLRRVDNIKMDLRQIGWDGVDWIDMAQNRDQWRAIVNTVLSHRVP
jgi:hypothetical protein